MTTFQKAAVAVTVLLLASTAQAQYNLLHQFGSSDDDGANPFGSLTLSGSTLCGMTSRGGTNFVITRSGHTSYEGVIFSLGGVVAPPLQITSITQTGQ